MKCLLRIMQGYWITHSDNYMPEVSPTQDNTNCFSSHRSYEIGLHFLLSFVETKQMIELTYNSLDTQILNSYLYLLAENIPQDISYHTQEISLDIMCRLYIYLKRVPSTDTTAAIQDTVLSQPSSLHTTHTNSSLLYLLSHLPASLVTALQDTAIGPINIIKDMRPHICKVNVANANIISIPYATFHTVTTTTPSTTATATASTTGNTTTTAAGVTITSNNGPSTHSTTSSTTSRKTFKLCRIRRRNDQTIHRRRLRRRQR